MSGASEVPYDKEKEVTNVLGGEQYEKFLLQLKLEERGDVFRSSGHRPAV